MRAPTNGTTLIKQKDGIKNGLCKTQKKVMKRYNRRKVQFRKILEKITTIHGTSYSALQSNHTARLWLILMLGNAMLTIVFLMVIKERYNSDQIVVQMNSDSPVNQIPFPAVSICNYNLVSFNESRPIARILKNNGVTEKRITHFLQELQHQGILYKGPDNFSDVMDILKNHYYGMENIMEEVHQKCENLLLYCEFNSKKKNCDDIFNLVQTYKGLCCTFNYAGLNDDVDNPLASKDEDFEYYYDDSQEEETRIISTAQSGRTSGLRVVYNLQPSDYPEWAVVMSYGAQIILSDPNDYPEVSSASHLTSIGESLVLKVEPLIFLSDKNLRRMDPAKRGCWYHDEVLLQHTERYSYETCESECKMMNFLKNCGCIPYQYPSAKPTRVCELADAPCLKNMTVYWSAKKIPCVPQCFFECSDKTYTQTSDSVPFPKDHYLNVVKGRNISELSALHVFFVRPLCNSYKQALVIDYIYFVATYGGVFSISCGFSLISLTELMFLLTRWMIKLAWNVLIHLIERSPIKKIVFDVK